MPRRILVSSIAAVFPIVTFAQASDSYQCTMAGLSRRVEIAREGTAPVPCEVLYFKDTEAPGQRQVLWSAANEAGYCEAQAQGFVQKLEGLGWDCTAMPGAPAPAAAAAPPAAPAPAAPTNAPAAPAEPASDDTEALSAPEPR
jgi:hypothetical protein